MSGDVKFDDYAQRDLMAAAAHLYEADMYDLCMGLLLVLIKYGDESGGQTSAAHVLFGHCISEHESKYGDAMANKHYEIACDMGSAVGCYNLHLNHTKTNPDLADEYLAKAVALGWED